MHPRRSSHRSQAVVFFLYVTFPGAQACDAKDREELFDDFIKEREAKEREKKKEARRKQRDAFRLLLEASKGIKWDTPYRKAVVKLEGDSAYEECDKSDRLDVFQEYVRCEPSKSNGKGCSGPLFARIDRSTPTS